VNRRAPILVGVAAAVLVALAVFFLVLPKSAEISSTQEQLTTAQEQENSLRVQLRALQEAQAEAPQTRRAIERIETQVPQTADLPALIRLLRDAADRAAVDLFQFSPSNPTADPAGQFSTISTAVNVTGSYFALDEFLFRLESLPRAAKVTNVSIAPGAATTGTTTTTTTTTTGTPTPSPTTPTSTTTATSLSMQLTVEFYTSDLSAGPGSVPGPTTTTAGA
jgi:Tfp pilus assembly protein PilO